MSEEADHTQQLPQDHGERARRGRVQGASLLRSSVNIGRLFGIEFRVHVTFFLLLFFVFVSVFNEQGLAGAVLATLFICAVFVCVVIHEVGHSLVARRFGKQARSITLLPIGGVAAMDEIPEKPGQEIAMAIIGPFINFAIAAVLYLFVGTWTGIGESSLYPQSIRDFLGSLMSVNVWLAIFNLTPALPMDGGRVLRAILATRMDYVRATTIAVFVGQAIATIFIFYGIFNNFWLALVGLFVYIGASSEKRHVALRSLLREVTVSEAMTTEFVTLQSDEPLSRALEHFHHGCQDDFLVVGGSGLEGILTRDRILASLHEKGLGVSVAEVMDRDLVAVSPRAPLEQVYRMMVSSGKTAVAVVDEGQVKGMICVDRISRYLMLRAAMQKDRR